MEYSEAITKRDLLQTELNEISRLFQSSKMSLYILPKLVYQEIERLSDDLHKAMMSTTHQIEPADDIRIPVEGESMLSKVPVEFALSSAEATQKFKQKLNSELEELKKSTVPIHFTSEFIQKVIDHTEAYLKKQRQHECAIFGPKDDQTVKMDYYNAIQKRDRLQADLKKIGNFASEREFNLSLLPKLTDSEIQRLRDDTSKARLSKKHYLDETKIPVEGALMLSSVPTEYGLSSAAETEKFIQELRDEHGWLMSLPEKFPIIFNFILRVIDHAERYMREKRQFEVAVFGRSTTDDDDQTT